MKIFNADICVCHFLSIMLLSLFLYRLCKCTYNVYNVHNMLLLYNYICYTNCFQDTYKADGFNVLFKRYIDCLSCNMPDI